MTLKLELGPVDNRQMRICPICDTELPANSNSKTGACSPGCASILKGRQYQAAQDPVSCGACGDLFMQSDHQRWRTTAEGTRPTCSDECRVVLSSEASRGRLIGPRRREMYKPEQCVMHPSWGWAHSIAIYPSSCIDCGTLEFRKGPSKRCRPCANQHNDRNKSTRHRARAQQVYQRDRWICQLCGDPVNQDAHYLEPDAPTLDHIIPRSMNGSDAAGNLQTAHRYCNSSRGNEPLPGRLY